MDDGVILPAGEPEALPENMVERLREHALRLFEATKGVLPVEMAMHVRVHPGGLVRLEYHASVGDGIGSGIAARRYAFGSSPETVAAELYEKVADNDIVRKVRTEKLREMAKELGFRLRPAKDEVPA